MDVNVGVINPYALGELIAQRKINWEQLSDPEDKLAEILKVDKNAIFDIKNPILNPSIEIESNGNIKQLSESVAASRLKSFLGERAVPASPRVLYPGLRVAPALEAKVAETFLATAVHVSSAGTAWMPANKEWFDKGDYFEDVGEVTVAA